MYTDRAGTAGDVTIQRRYRSTVECACDNKFSPL